MLCFSLQYSQKNSVNKIDTIYKIHSDNTDCLARMSMFLVHFLHEAITRNFHGQCSFVGSIMIRGHNKSHEQLMKIKGFRIELIGKDIVGTGNGVN